MINTLFAILAYPFVSFLESLKDTRTPRPSVSVMEDYLFLYSFSLLYGRTFIALCQIVSSVAVTVFGYLEGFSFLKTLLLSYLAFIVSCWMASVFIYTLQMLSYSANFVRDLKKKIESALDLEEDKKDKKKGTIH